MTAAKRILMAAVGLLLLALAGTVTAASFDCRRATAPVEKAICSDTGLDHQDTELARQYRQALAQLSPQGQRTLQTGQREWLALAHAACGASVPCLKEQYLQRSRDLSTAVQKIGPFVFNRVDHYLYTPGRRNEAGSDGLVHTALPRVDAPANAVAAELNREFEGLRASDDTDCGNGFTHDQDYTLDLATDKLVSLKVSDWEECHGAPHGHGGSYSALLLLRPRVRKLVATDVFRPDTPWQAYLSQRAQAALERRGITGDHYMASRDEFVSTVTQLVADVGHWSATPSALHVRFNPYEVAGYVDGETDVEVPWADLRPYLQADAPVR